MEDIGCLSSLKELNLSGNNFEYLPRSIAQLCALRSLDLSHCNKLTYNNISSLQHGISVSDSLSLRVFMSRLKNIPSWFYHQGMDASVSVNLPENWYVDMFLGFAACYSGKLIGIRAHLFDDEMTQKFALSNHSKYHACSAIHFFLVPNANGKTANNYGHFRLFSTGEKKKFGICLLYKDEPALHIGIRRSRYELHFMLFSTLKVLSHSSKQRSQVQARIID